MYNQVAHKQVSLEEELKSDILSQIILVVAIAKCQRNSQCNK